MDLSNHRFLASARWPLLPFVAASALSVSSHLGACEIDQQHIFRINATGLSDALLMIARTGGCVVSFKPESVRHHRSETIEGSLTVQQAIDRALRGTGLEVYQTRNGTLTLRRLATSPSPLAEK